MLYPLLNLKISIKYYFLLCVIICISLTANLFFSYGFSILVSNDLIIFENTLYGILFFISGKSVYTICSWEYSRISIKLKLKIKSVYYSQYSEVLFGAEYEWLCLQNTGDLMGRICEDADCSAEAIAVYIPKLFKSILILLSNILLIMYFDFTLMLLFLLPIPFLFLAEFWGRNRGQRLLKKSTDILSEKNALFQDVVHHNELIFHSSIQNDMVARVQDKIKQYSAAQAKSMGALVAFMSPALLLNKLPLILVAIYGSYLVNESQLPFSAFMTIFTLSYLTNVELSELDDFMANFPTLLVFCNRLIEILHCPIKKYGTKNCSEFLTQPQKYTTAISFHGVNFKYKHSEYGELLKNISFEQKIGEKILFTGCNGSGKTTILKLISGIVSPSQGNIIILDEPVYNYSFQGLTCLIAYVSSNTLLWDGTIKENANAAKEMTLPEWDALFKYFDFYSAFPDKTIHQILEFRIISNGKNLSGGQRQRIGFARAWVQNTPILLIDEGTNNLDPDAEHNILEFICSSNKTICMTSHHANILSYFDAIYEVKNSHITLVN